MGYHGDACGEWGDHVGLWSIRAAGGARCGSCCDGAAQVPALGIPQLECVAPHGSESRLRGQAYLHALGLEVGVKKHLATCRTEQTSCTFLREYQMPSRGAQGAPRTGA